MSATRRFRTAVEAKDIDAAMGLFAEDATFHSPVVFSAYNTHAEISAILHAVTEVFEDFRYVDELTSWDRAIFVFEATVDGKQVTGIDYLTVKDGMISDLTVFIRPMSGLTVLAERMKAMLEAAGA